MATMASPSRRVLGSKDPNAPLQQQSSKTPNRTLHVANPASHMSVAKRPLSPANSAATSPRIGQKRKIEAVDEAEQANSQETISAHPGSQATEMLSDMESDHEEDATPLMTHSKSTLNTTFSSFRDSQEESTRLEPEFHILEEPSQQTLDTMHAVSFTQNTSQLIPALRPNLFKEASQISLSMSSLIDFNSEDDDMEMIEELAETKSAEGEKQMAKENARREMMVEKAETLRTRLQLAFYKIQTNQITSPFARLQVPKPTSPELAARSSSPSSSSTIQPDRVQATAISPESRVAIARARATSGPKPAVQPLSTLPMPQLAPTAFSARWNRELNADHEARGSQPGPNLPSSPPSQENTLPKASTLKKVPLEPKTPIQLSSPVASEYEDDGEVRLRRSRPRPRGLTSSVVKGEAANSLLELVKGARSGGV